MDQEQYDNKRIQVIDKFSKMFIEKNRYNAYSVKVIESLIRGEDPYSIIEQLLENQEKLINDLVEVLDKAPIKPIILKK